VPTSIGASYRSWLVRFFVREDAVYQRYESAYQAKTTLAKATYLLLYLLPGIVVFLFLNVEPVFRAETALTGLHPMAPVFLGAFRYFWMAYICAIPGPPIC
jgi:hypothetical protein